MTSTPGDQAVNTTVLMIVVIFIRQTTETLPAYKEQIKAKLSINLTHQETL